LPESSNASAGTRVGGSSEPPAPELFFGIVAAIGAEVDLVTTALTAILAEVGYSVEDVRLSTLLANLERVIPLRESPIDSRYKDYMDAGDSS
jgi:hypothetical protein